MNRPAGPDEEPPSNGDPLPRGPAGEDNADDGGPGLDIFEAAADAAGRWREYRPAPVRTNPDQIRWDVTRWLVTATLLVIAALLGLVATKVVTVEGAVQLAAAVLGPLFTLLGLAVGYHFKGQNHE